MVRMIFLLGLLSAFHCAAAERWLYIADNLQVNERVDRLVQLLERASQAGYTHVLLHDSKFSRLDSVLPHYFTNAARLQAAARAANIELVPAVFPVGYSNDLLWHDPHLVEGPPVREAVFVVRDGVARLEPDPTARLTGGDMADLGLWSWRDDNMVPDKGAVRVTDPHGANARIVQRLALTPFRQYHLTVRVRTDDFAGTPEAKVLDPQGHPLNFNPLGVARTQDWQTHHVVFNSLTNREANLYLGTWGGTTGSLWWDDAVLEETALVNLIRREGAPFTIQLESGRELIEGEDFEPVSDPLMGTRPWAGCYDVYHEPPVIRMKGDCAEGTRLRVSFQHAATIYDGQAMLDIAELRALELLRDQARRVHELFHAQGYMMSFDEVRVLGWSEAFRQRSLTPGQLLAENVRACAAILRELNPGGKIYTWSDMFDPHHNAVPGPYYLVNGPLTGAWEGLDADVILLQWHGDTAKGRADSLKFFADRGHKQILAAYYDEGPAQVSDWLESARGIPGVQGVMYTTWQGRYDELEAVSTVLDQADW